MKLRLTIAAALLAGCSQGEKRDFVGPPDTHPIDNTIAAIVVTPSVVTGQRGDLIDFAAFARNNKGDSVGADVSWTATGGTVTSSGRFSAETAGRYWVIARSTTSAGKSDSASVYIAAPDNPIVDLTVSPKTATMHLGQTRQFRATATLESGQTAEVPVFWSASEGTIGSDGTYTPSQPGTYLIIGIVGSGLSDTAQVTITGTGILTSISLSPAVDTVDEGETRQFVVDAKWSNGQDTVPPVDFSTSGGAISASGAYVAAAAPGDYVVKAVRRGGSETATAKVRVRERVAGVTITPAAVTVAPGGTVQFTSMGKLRNGKSTGVDGNWSATGGTISRGVYHAGSLPGSYRVIVTLDSGPADTAAVTIASPSATLQQLVLNPGAVTLGAGESRQFAVSGSWSDGSSTTPLVFWTGTGGTTSQTGYYTAGSVPGTYSLIVRHQPSGKADTSKISITGPTVTTVVASPATATVVSGGTQQFSVKGTWSDGSSAPPPVTWQTGGGSISPTGLFTAGPLPGTFLVIATAPSGAADTSFATVTSPPAVLSRISVSPGTAAVEAGSSQQFFATAVWSNGNTSTPAAVWSATGGSITTGGKFTGGSVPGTFRVIAKDPSGLADTAEVTVTPKAPTLTGISLSPVTATLQPGGVQQFDATGIWTGGGSGSVAVTYSAIGGSISPAGLFQAGTEAGTYRVIAKQVGGTFADTAKVTITAASPALVGLTVSPDQATVGTGESRSYSVAGVWTNGGSGTPAVTWSATGGSITSAGVYTAGPAAGTYRVVATEQGGTLADTVTVEVAASGPTLKSLEITPDNQLLQTGTSVQYRAKASWSAGGDEPPPLDWKATGGTISTAGVYSAGTTPGIYQVIAKEHSGSIADTTTVTLSGPYVSKIVISPATASVLAGGTQQFQVAATWSDGASRPAAVTFTATGGTVSVNGLFTAGSVAGSFMVIANCSCGKADTSIVSVTAAAPSQPELVSLKLSPASVTLAPGATQQYTLTAKWSDGATIVPAVNYSTTGGSISSGGLYSAPAAAGSYRVVVVEPGSGVADTADVTVQGGAGGSVPASGTALIREDFSGYTSTADLLKYPNPMWSGATEDVQPSRIFLDPSGPPTGGKSMRYDFPAKALTDPNLCHDYTIGRNIQFPYQVTEVWVEFYAKFSSGFTTLVPGGKCSGISTAGYKFLQGRVPNGGRFNTVVGLNGGLEVTLGYPLNEGAASYLRPNPSVNYLDGNWHRFRYHMRVGTNGLITAYVDNSLIGTVGGVAINRSGILGLALGRNMNQGPVTAESVWWAGITAWKTDPGWGW